MSKIKNVEQLRQLPEIVELTKILEDRGYKQQVFSDSPEEVLSFRLVKGTVVAEVEVSDTIHMWVFTTRTREEGLKKGEEKELNDIADVIGYIGNKYGYVLNEDQNMLYRNLKIESEHNEENSTSKNFLIFNENETDLEEKVKNFVKQKFGEKVLNKVSIDIETECEDLGTPDYKEYLTIELKFNEFKYDNKVYGKQVESIGMVLENKGLQSFYIDGKFISLNVYEWIQGNLLQTIDEVYGFSKDEIYDAFNDFILTC